MKRMRSLSGKTLEQGEKLSFVWNADLVYYDGPLVSLFKKEDDDFIFFWVDCDRSHHRWVVAPAPREQLKGYLNRDISLLDLIQAAKTLIVFESTKAAR